MLTLIALALTTSIQPLAQITPANLKAVRVQASRLPNMELTSIWGSTVVTTIPLVSLDLAIEGTDTNHGSPQLNIIFPPFTITKVVDKTSNLPYQALSNGMMFITGKINTAAYTIDFSSPLTVKKIVYTVATDGTPLETIQFSTKNTFKITWK